jgi:predicted transcriptional regulator
MSQQYTDRMEVNLSPDLEDKLARAAGRRGISAEILIREAIERAVDYDEWFIREVDKGLAQIDSGQVLTHEAVGAQLEQRLANHQSRRG